MTKDYMQDLFDKMISDLRKGSPIKCQSCELLFAEFRDGDKGEGWYMDCETKPECYQDDTSYDKTVGGCTNET
jgi:hypothetical protein